MPVGELVEWPYDVLRSALDERTLKAADVVREYGRRIESYPGLAAYVALDIDRALDQASLLDRELDGGHRRGPIHGVPVSCKDNIAVAGLPMAGGSAAYDGFRPARDAAAVARVRAAGGVVLGKNGMHEVGIGDPVRRGKLPTGIHPRNPDFLPGGSSSGPAVAVAAGLTQIALGADTGGSIRNPAASCGVIGFKPTYGRVPTAGSLPLCWSMDTLGPIARDVAAVEAAFTALVGEAPEVPPPDAPRFGVLPVASLDELQEQTLDALEHSRRGVAAGGGRSLDVPAIDLQAAGPAWLSRLAEMAAVHALASLADQPGLSPTIAEILVQGGEVTREEYAESWRTQARLEAEVDRSLDGCEALVVPVNPGPAALRWGEWHGLNVFNWYRYCWPFNLTGHPAITIPVASDEHGVPIGVQLVGRRGRDLELLACARWFTRHVPFDTLSPVAGHW